MYEFNLDLPESKRWKTILQDYDSTLQELKPIIDEMLKPFSSDSSYIRKCIWIFDKLGQISHSGELKEIASYLKIDFYVVVMLQLFFEIHAGCTAIVNNKILFRVMDWPLEFLKKLTIDLKVMKNGNVLYYATTWVGYTGILTSTKPGMNAVAVNNRGTFSTSLYEYVKEKGSSLINKTQVGLALRYANEHYRDEEDFLRYLKNIKLISPCYFTVCSLSRTSRVIIRGTDDHRIIEKDSLIIANIDPDKDERDVCNSKERINFAETMLRENPRGKEDFLKCFLQSPIINENSIYACYLNPNDWSESSTTVFK